LTTNLLEEVWPQRQSDESLCDLCNGDTGTTHSLDLLLSRLAEELGLDDHWLVWQVALAEYLEETSLGDIDHGDLALSLDFLLLVLGAGLGRHQRPQPVEVDHRAEVLILGLVEVPHADLTEIPRVVFVEVDAMVVLTTSVTATTGVLAVLADTPLAVGHVAAGLSALLQPCCHPSLSLSLSLYFICSLLLLLLSSLPVRPHQRHARKSSDVVGDNGGVACHILHGCAHDSCLQIESEQKKQPRNAVGREGKNQCRDDNDSRLLSLGSQSE